VIQRLRLYNSLVKPRLSTLVLLTALCGAAVAPGPLSFLGWISLFLGTFGIVGAANALNCYLERDVDALMERTAQRPLVTGELSPSEGLLFALTLSLFSMLILAFGVNFKTAALGALGHILYVAVYTPMKRKSMGALFTGAIPGAVPPLMGWAAVRNDIELGGWILFGILFFWQLPHFIAISLFRQNEYDRAGLKTVPGTMGALNARLQMLLFSGLLAVVGLLPYIFGLAGPYYFVAASVLGLAFTAIAVRGFLEESAATVWVRFTFFGTLAYLPAVLGMWVLDQWIVRLVR
jgi:protoheme IX farnesyltransferase